MMTSLLTLSLWQGILVIILVITVPGVIVYLAARKFVGSGVTRQHERVGRLLFRVSASLLALLISLSYANEKIAYNKVVDSLEEEASLISSLMIKLKLHQSEQAETVIKGLTEYVNYTIEDKWRDVMSNPYYSKMMGTMVRINIIALGLPETNERQITLKNQILNDLDLLTKTMQVRFYSTNFHLPYLAYILGFGLVIVWCFFSVYKPDHISITFLTMYNIFLAVVLYFVITLGNPMVGPLKIRPEPFIILQEKGMEKLPL